jgi:hypothetical protein
LVVVKVSITLWAAVSAAEGVYVVFREVALAKVPVPLVLHNDAVAMVIDPATVVTALLAHTV